MVKGIISTPYDAALRQLPAQADTVYDPLVIHLPPALRQRCNLGTLQLKSASLIEENLRAWYSDVPWSFKTTSDGGYTYVVIEYQSSPDAQMAFHLVRYAITAMQRHLDSGHTRSPLVVPMLFYHGMITPYPWSLNWLDCFTDPQLARGFYISPLPLVDIAVIPDDKIVSHRRVALLEPMRKHICQRDLMNIAGRLMTILLSGDANDKQLKTLFNCLLQTGNVHRFGQFIHKVAQRVSQHRENLVTIAERLQEMGCRKSKREGRQEGQHAEALRIAQRMPDDGIARKTIMKITGLVVDEIVALERR